MPRLHQGLALLAALALAAGCASRQPYADLPEKNLRVRTEAVGASVVMGVHRLDEKCFAKYQGAVTLGYEARVTYKDSLYDAALFELDPRSGRSRELPARAGC